MKVFFPFFNLYFVNRKLKMWTKVVFFTCVNSSSFTWVIVIAYLRYLERLFSVRFWHLGLLVFKLFTWDEVISTDMKVIDWYISHSSGNKYLVVNIGSIQMRSKLNRCKIIFFWEKVKFIWSLCIVCMWFWIFLMILSWCSWDIQKHVWTLYEVSM
jgi:hypothetical protein